jgi:hypothetical protein
VKYMHCVVKFGKLLHCVTKCSVHQIISRLQNYEVDWQACSMHGRPQ